MTIDELAKKIKVKKKWLQGVFQIESHNNPRAVNFTSGAVGLIQFLPYTALSLGTNCSKLLKMKYEEQLDYVYKYYAPFTGRLYSFVDVYLAVFYPVAIFQPDFFVLGLNENHKRKIAMWNKSFDINKDNAIEKGEIKKYLRKHYNKYF